MARSLVSGRRDGFINSTSKQTFTPMALKTRQPVATSAQSKTLVPPPAYCQGFLRDFGVRSVTLRGDAVENQDAGKMSAHGLFSSYRARGRRVSLVSFGIRLLRS